MYIGPEAYITLNKLYKVYIISPTFWGGPYFVNEKIQIDLITFIFNQFTAIMTTHVVIENVMYCAIMTTHVVMVDVCKDFDMSIFITE